MSEAIIILFVAAAYAKINATSRACEAAVNRNALAIDRRPPARRRRTVPCDLRRASLPVPLLFAIIFVDTLSLKKSYDMLHRVWYSCASGNLDRV